MGTQTLDFSKKKLVKIINSKLKELEDKITLEEIQEAREFLTESKQIAEMLVFISNDGRVVPNADYPLYQNMELPADDNSQTETAEDFILNGCKIIATMYNLLDDSFIREAGVEWIREEAEDYLEYARNLFGSKCPAQPIIQLECTED